MSRLREALEAGEFVVTGEIAPPFGTNLDEMKRSIEIVGPVCHGLNVTDNQGATLHLSSLAASKVVLDMGFEPIFQQTCRDRNRLALQSDLLAASTLGVENVLVLSGDDPRLGDHPHARGVFDLDSTQLVSIAANMNEGRDMMGRELDGGTNFIVGAAMFPEAEPWDSQYERALCKAEAGARFFQTQAVFDMQKLRRAVEDLRPIGAKIIAGIILLKSPGVVDFINERLAGLMVPDDIADRIRSAENPKEESIRLAIEQAAELLKIADGIHIMHLGVDEAVERIVRDSGIS